MGNSWFRGGLAPPEPPHQDISPGLVHLGLLKTKFNQVSMEFLIAGGASPPEPPHQKTPPGLVNLGLLRTKFNQVSMEFLIAGGLAPPSPPTKRSLRGWWFLVFENKIQSGICGILDSGGASPPGAPPPKDPSPFRPSMSLGLTYGVGEFRGRLI